MNEIIPFGKYKGQPVEVLQNDPQYYDWLMAQDWFQQKFKNIYTVVVNNFSEPSETPEHNAMQVKVLDKDWCTRLLYKLYETKGWGDKDGVLFGFYCADSGVEQSVLNSIAKRCLMLNSSFASLLPELKSSLVASDGVIDARPIEKKWRALNQTIGLMYRLYVQHKTIKASLVKGEFLPKTKVSFEFYGFDAVIEVCHTYYSYDQCSYQERKGRSILCEMKPSMGDDFPAVLRQIKGNFDRANNATRREYNSARKILVLGRYTGAGATYSQMVSMFATEDIEVIMESSIDDLLIPDSVEVSNRFFLAVDSIRLIIIECCSKLIQSANLLKTTMIEASGIIDIESSPFSLRHNPHFSGVAYEQSRFCDIVSADTYDLKLRLETMVQDEVNK